MQRIGILPSLKLHIHFTQYLGISCLSFLCSADFLSWTLHWGCQSLHRAKRARSQRVEKGSGRSSNKCLTAEGRDGESSFRVRHHWGPVTCHCGQKIPEQSSPCLSSHPFSKNTCSVIHLSRYIICKPEHPSVLISPTSSCSNTKHTSVRGQEPARVRIKTHAPAQTPHKGLGPKFPPPSNSPASTCTGKGV